nr:hypothetical protein [Tanacetum cinerariifolium]
MDDPCPNLTKRLDSKEMMIEEKIKSTKGVTLRGLEETKERKECLQEKIPPKRNGISAAAIEQLITQRVADALLDYETNRNNRNGNNNGNGSHDLGSGLAHWFEKVEYVFHISNFAVECQSLMKMMTEAYCSRNKIQKLENELWNLTVNGTDLVERFIWGLPDSIKRNVTSSKPTRLQEAIEIANGLMDQKIHVFAARQADNKRRMENNPKEDYVQQPPYKRQNIARAYTTGPGEKKEYDGTLPLCNKCKDHHTGPRTAKCGNYKRIDHQTKDCKSLAAATNQRAPMANQRTLTCFECGEQGHYRSECLELKN